MDDLKILMYTEWNNIKDLTDKEKSLVFEEARKCRMDFKTFLKWVRLLSVPTLESPGGLIQYEMWPHLIEVADAFLTNRFLTVMKSRQIGLSILLASYVNWFAITHRGAVISLFSKGELEAFELLDKVRRIYRYLPPLIKIATGADSKAEMTFPSKESVIHAYPATETASVGQSVSLMICDEWDIHPLAQDNYLNAKPTIDQSGGQFIGVFTVDKKKPDTFAKSTFRAAMDGKIDFKPLFYPWNVVPGRDEEWYRDKEKNATQDELMGLTPREYMEQNYPRSIEEALSPTSTVSVFDKESLDDMMSQTNSPIKVTREGIDSSIVKIFQDHYIGNYYIVGTDTSHGVGKDYAVTTVMNVQTGVIVADILNNLLSPEELALHSVRMLDVYQNPLWFIEVNDWGKVTLTRAQDLGYKNFGYSDEKKKKLGFDNRSGTRDLLWGGLIPAINNRQIRILNAEGLKQFYDIIRNSEKEGRIEATSGRNDDYPTAVGICWLKKDEVKTYKPNIKPIETLHFNRGGVEALLRR
jgi:hypothetical protein